MSWLPPQWLAIVTGDTPGTLETIVGHPTDRTTPFRTPFSIDPADRLGWWLIACATAWAIYANQPHEARVTMAEVA